MSWTQVEWDAFATLIEEGWPGEFDDAARKAWRVLLDSLEPERAIECLRRLLLEGHTFRPSVSEFLAAARRDPARPTWDEAYILIRRAMRQQSRNVRARSEPLMIRARCQVMQDWLGWISPFVAGFTAQQTFARLTQLPLDDPAWGQKTRRDLERAYDRYCETSDAREVAVIASGHPGELGRLDPLTALGLNKPKPEQLREGAALI